MSSRPVRRTLRKLRGPRVAAATPTEDRKVEAPPGLTSLAKQFGTDKWSQVHRYTPHYQRHFRGIRHQPLNLLEIGIGGYARDGQGGASLRMWKAYFPQANIYGLDIEDKSFVDEPRIVTFQGDQSDPATLRRVLDITGPLDVIIDDGSHRSPHVRASFEFLFPELADNGLYVIEDTQSSYWPEWAGSEDLNATTTSMAMVKQLVDGLNHVEFVTEPYEPTYTDQHVIGIHCYHNLVFIEKGDNQGKTRKRQILRERYEAQP